MSDYSNNSKRIAKNTILLYFRMLFLMLLSLYTSRVVLDVLGVEDYGLYNVVGGVTVFLSFLNSSLSNGTSRFITYEMGKQKDGDTKKVFQNAFFAHGVLAIIVLLLLETIGLWFLYSKLGIAEDRMNAALFVYQLSIFTTIAGITQVPYSSLIISHEKMNIYAYIGIIDGILKLVIVYLLLIWNDIDKLKLYAFLFFLIQMGDLVFYRCYCIRKFKESSLSKFQLDNGLIRKMLGFSGWSLIGNLAHTLNAHGMTIITNMFFGPAVVAARALATSVNGAVMSLSSNFRTAANPQIIKSFSSGDIVNSKRLMLSTTRYSVYLMLALSIPLIFSCEEIISLWLKEVPEWTVIFVQLILIQTTLFTFDTCFYTGLYACGKVSINAMISPSLYFCQFIVVYILFRHGFSPITMSIAGIITSGIAAFIVKPILLKKLAGYNYPEIYIMIFRCIMVFVTCLIVPLLLAHFASANNTNIIYTFTKTFVNFIYSFFIIVYLGFNKSERTSIINVLKSKLCR